MRKAVLFDLDGLMIDSEPFWRRSEIAVFEDLGVTLTEEDCRVTVGLRIDEVIHHWAIHRPWSGPSEAEVVEQVLDRMVHFLSTEAEPKAGLHAAIEACEAAGLRMAVASSSATRLIDAAVTRLGVRDRFAHRISAEHEEYGKPHPAVFLTAAKALGVAPTECLVLEDSLNGVIAAKAARMTCVAIPEEESEGDERFAIADAVLGSLEELPAWLAAR